MRRNMSHSTRRVLIFGALLSVVGLVLSANAEEQKLNRLTNLTVTEAPTATEIVVRGSAPPTFTVFKLTEPTRLFIDVSNADISALDGLVEVENGVVGQITPLQFADDLVRIGRIIVGLEVDALYSVKAVGNDLKITIDASQRRTSVTSVADSSARLAAAEARAKDAEARARQAEAAAQSAEARIAAAEAKARNAEAKAIKLAQDADARASTAEAQANRLMAEATEARASAKNASDAAKAEAESRAQIAERRAAAADAKAQAARAEASAASTAAQARSEAADARVAEVTAQLAAERAAAKASQQDVQRLKSDAAKLSENRVAAIERAEAAERALRAAQDKLRASEQETAEATEAAAKATQQAAKATQQAAKAIQSADARVAAAEERSKLAEAEAQREARRAQKQADAASARANEAESRANQLAQAAERAREQAASAEQALKERAEQQASKAEEKADAAEARAQAARSEAAAAEKAALARSLAAEARAKAAEARAKAAEAQAQESSAEAQRKTKEAERLARSAESAESRARQAEANLEIVSGQLATALNQIEKSERAVLAAEENRKRAEANVTAARSAAERARANAALAESRIAEASAKAQAADLRAQAAETRASQAESSAQSAQSLAAKLRKDAQGEADRQLASKAEATARAASAEAKAARLEAERAALTQQIGVLEAERSRSKAKVKSLERDRQQLQTDLAAAQTENNQVRAEQLETEKRENEALSNLENARVAKIESEQAISRLSRRVKDLETKVARAQQTNPNADVSGLNRELATARAREGALAASAEQAGADLARAEAETRQMKTAAVAAVPPTTPTVSTPEENVTESAPRTVAPAAPIARPMLPPPPPQMRNRIVNVKFAETKDASTVQIQVEGTPDYVVKQEGQRTRILELRNAVIDPSLERSLDTSEFGGAVQLVSSFQAPPPGDTVRIVVTLGEDVKHKVVSESGRIAWRFDRPERTISSVASLPPPPTWSAPVTSSTEVRFEQPKAAVFTGLNQSIAIRSEDRPAPTRRRRYGGRKINIDIKDGDIHNILRLLAKEGNVNIVTSDEVQGNVTMHLKLVPWDQALDIILRTKGLDMVRENDIIRVAPIESIAKEREAELKKIEVKEKLKPLEVKLVTVNHASASDLIARVKSVLSKRGSAEFDSRTNTVILKDIDEHLEAAEDIIRRLDTQTPQVLIEARIVEVNEVNIQQFGIQWGIDSTYSVATGNPTGLRFPSSIGIAGGADDSQGSTEGVSSNPNYVVNLPASAGLGSGGALGLTFGSIDSTFNLNVRLSALENRGSVKIVSSPKITTLDNKNAEISQGVSIPISQVSANGIQTVFFDAVLSLTVTPHVTQDGNIYLKLNAKNNTPDFQNVGARGDPTILKKEAQTELLLKDGDTTVIGGIYTSNAGYNSNEVPYLARIPILGAMFRSQQNSDRRSELLIFVTPRIVNRAASQVRTSP